MREISRLSENLLVSEEGFCSVELVIRDKVTWKTFMIRLTQIVFVNIAKGFKLRPAFPVSKLCAL